MLKPLVIGALLGLMLAWSYPAGAQEVTSSCEANFRNLTDEQVVEAVNALPDECRFELDAAGNLPAAPEGYGYAEDLTLVPLSFWQAPANRCYYLDLTKIAESTVEETREALVSQGWYPDPSDQAETLYSPSCDLGGEHLEQRATLEQLRALRAEVDTLRVEVRQLLAIIEGVINTVGQL